MKKYIQITVLLSIISLTTGCSTPYMIDRQRDAADVFNLSFGIGVGAQARVGPIKSGLGFHMEVAGLRCGEFTKYLASIEGDNVDVACVICFGEVFKQPLRTPEQRNKLYSVYGFILGLPKAEGRGSSDHRFQYYTQLEITAAVAGGVRLGFNPGELMDFFLGWFGIDIYSDDIEMKRIEKESNKTRKAIASSKAGQAQPYR